MGAYKRCVCGHTMPGPWDLTTLDLLKALLLENEGIECKGCGGIAHDYGSWPYREDVVEELAKRIDSKKEKTEEDAL